MILDLRRAGVLAQLFALSVLVGLIAGLGAVVFHVMLGASAYGLLDYLAGYRPPGAAGEPPLFGPSTRPFSRWVLFLLPIAGGLVAGAIVQWFAPEAEGHGTDAAIRAYHREGGRIRARVPLIKAISSAITIGSGGSAGREGPIAQIGAGFGAIVSRALRLSDRERRILMAAGMGAGVGAIFRAPLAGAIFAAEVLYAEMDLETEVIVPSILASIVAYSVFSFAFGADPLFATPAYGFHHPVELVGYALLAVVVAIMGLAYIRGLYGVRDAFRRIRLPKALKPALGGVVVGAIGLWLPSALSSSYGVCQSALRGEALPLALFAVALAKIAATSFTIGSGGSGGVFGPSMVIGAAVGGAFGSALHAVAPTMAPHPGAFALVGMAGFFSGVASTPISTVIMVSEMTGNYNLLVPSMWVCLLAFLLLRGHSIYEQQLPTRADSPVHLGEMLESALQRILVGDVLARRSRRLPVTVPETAGLRSVMDRFADTGLPCIPVVDDNGDLTGVVHLTTLQSVMSEQSGQLFVAADLAVPPLRVRASDSLEHAVATMVTHDRDALLVVEDARPDRITDILTAGDVQAVWEHHIGQAGHSATATPFSGNILAGALRPVAALWKTARKPRPPESP